MTQIQINISDEYDGIDLSLLDALLGICYDSDIQLYTQKYKLLNKSIFYKNDAYNYFIRTPDAIIDSIVLFSNLCKKYNICSFDNTQLIKSVQINNRTIRQRLSMIKYDKSTKSAQILICVDTYNNHSYNGGYATLSMTFDDDTRITSLNIPIEGGTRVINVSFDYEQNKCTLIEYFVHNQKIILNEVTKNII